MGLETAAWRALAVFRGLCLGYAAVLYAFRYDEYAHPAGGWLVLAGMGVWTVLVSASYARPSGRGWPVLAADLAVAMAAIVLTRYLDDPDRVAGGAQTLPVAWAVAPVLAFAIRGGWVGGSLAALGVAVADVAHRGALTQGTAHNIVLVVLAGAVVGYVVSLARHGEAALSRALAVEAATRERERLARGIHDGVLQVLALVGRRGGELGGEAAALGRLAAEQEQALRALVTSAPGSGAGSAPGSRSAAGSAEEVDLRALLTSYASSSVTVSTPGTPVLVAPARARELAAAVAAALANVAAHAGERARAWVLLEDEGDDVVVSVRDDGVGFVLDRLQVAAAEGRLGVAQSIAGRVRDLGGTLKVDSAPGRGTEVELRVPRQVAS